MNNRLEILQAGRGLAALTIVAVHANNFDPISDYFFWGRFSVEFFFLLSGYVIYHAHSGQTFKLQRYLVGRLRRIFIPYLPVGIAAGVAYAQLGRKVDWVATLTLLPGQTALIPAWTLQHELAFYALTCLFFALRRPLLGASLWAAAIGARPLIDVPLSPTETVFLSPINLCFVTGAFLANFGIAPDIKVGRVLNLLGEASYSIYLVHLPLMGAMWRLGASFELMVAASVAGGFAYHFGFERPALAWVKARSEARKASSHEASRCTRQTASRCPPPSCQTVSGNRRRLRLREMVHRRGTNKIEVNLHDQR
jgi:exopolysaccharide production protein ExoZ